MFGLQQVFGKRPVLGIDIGTASIKMVEIFVPNGKAELSNYGLLEVNNYLERSNSVIQTSTLKISEKETAETLKILLDKVRPKTKDVIVTLPSFTAFTSIIEIPMMSSEDIAQAIPYQARSFVPLPISDVAIDWSPIDTFSDDKGNKKQRIFLMSVPNEEIKLYQSIFNRAGLNLKLIEIEGLGMARLLTSGESGNSIILDIGALTSSVMVAENGALKYVTQTDYAGASLTQALSKGLGINVKRAEALKKQRGLSGMGGQYGLSTLMLPFLDVILNEVRKAKDLFEKKYNSKIERIILTGGGADLIGISEYVSSQIGLPTAKSNPFKNISYSVSLAPALSSLSTRLCGAIGAAIKPF